MTIFEGPGIRGPEGLEVRVAEETGFGWAERSGSCQRGLGGSQKPVKKWPKRAFLEVGLARRSRGTRR